MARPLALVTGGWRRVGAAIARALAADGWDLALHAHHESGFDPVLREELEQAGAAVFALAADLGDPGAAAALPAETCRLAGRPVSLLVNNASLFRDDTFASFDASALDAHMAVNFKAPLLLTQAMVRDLGGADGAVVHVLDQRVRNPVPDQLSYTLSKQALHASVRTLARALAPRVRVNAVAPGPVLSTSDYSDAQWQGLADVLPLRQLPAADEIASAVVQLARARSVTGQTIYVDGGAHLEAYPRDFLYLTR